MWQLDMTEALQQAFSVDTDIVTGQLQEEAEEMNALL